MPVFLVVALKDSAESVDAAVAKMDTEKAYKVEPGKWFVNAHFTVARQLADSLGLRETNAHLVVPVRGYSGRAEPDLWEWLSAQSGKVDG